MSAAVTLSGAALLEYVKPDQSRLYANPPAYGTLTLSVTFHDGKPVRITYAAEISKQAKP